MKQIDMEVKSNNIIKLNEGPKSRNTTKKFTKAIEALLKEGREQFNNQVSFFNNKCAESTNGKTLQKEVIRIEWKSPEPGVQRPKPG